MGGSGEKEDIVFEDKEVEMTEIVGNVKADEVKETGAHRRDSDIWLRGGYANVEGLRVEEERDFIMRRWRFIVITKTNSRIILVDADVIYFVEC